MNLIDIYVSEVGRHLPKKTRADIEAEIRSILQDMLEERSQKTGKPVDEEMTLEVLKEYGAPDKVAATYMGERYLIGPQLYPIFSVLARLAVLVTGILAAIGLGVALAQTTPTPANVAETILKAFANFTTSVMVVLGNIVFILAIIEWALYRAGEKAKFKDVPKMKEWDPRLLMKISPSNRIKLGEVIIEIVGCFAVIVIFNFFPQIIGFTTSLNGLVESGNWAVGFGNLVFTPLLSEAFFRYVPYLTIIWGLTIILDIVLLRMGRWTVVTRIFLIGLKAANIVIAALMLAGPSLLAITTASLTTSLGDAETARTLMNLLSLLVRIALWLAIVGNSIDIIKTIYRLVTDAQFVFPAPEKS